MSTTRGSRRDFAALEARRFAAARLCARGQSQNAVARTLGVSVTAAHKWCHAWRAQGRPGLRAVGRAGRKPRLDRQQLARVETALRQGPRAHGFATELWTLPRIARLIERLTQVHYHPGHVWYILRGLGWSLQRPTRRARRGRHCEVEAPAVAAGKKNARRPRAWILFEDESGVSHQPVVRRTWAPRGQPPVLTHTAANWKRLSVAAGLAFRWDGRRTRLYFQTQPGSYTDRTLIAFLRDLKRHFRRHRVILVWDGLGAHKSRAMRAHLRRQRAWLTVEPLPAYAPDLNPVEQIWGNVKGHELANVGPTEIAALRASLRAGFSRIRRQPELAVAFLRHAGLSL
jgi:transposase